MKKSKLILAFALVACISMSSLAPSYFASESGNTAKQSTKTPSTSINIKPKAKRTRKKSGDHYNINVVYPRFENTELNKIIIKRVNDIEDSFWKTIGKPETWEEDTFVGSFTEFSIVGDYKYATSSNRYVSVIFDIGIFTGGAHSIPFISSICFDTKSNKALTLSDLFVKNSDYASRLSISTQKILKTKLKDIEPSFWEDTTNASADNFKFFGLTNKGLMLFFSPYTVAPYSYGTVSCTIPFSELSDILAIEIK